MRSDFELTWNHSTSEAIDGYNVYAVADREDFKIYTKLNDAPVTGNTFIVPGVNVHRGLGFVVRTVKGLEESQDSNTHWL